jgi:hypothetical protein
MASASSISLISQMVVPYIKSLHMRQQAFLFFAAVSISLAASAQQIRYFPTLKLVRYDFTNLNKPYAAAGKHSETVKPLPAFHPIPPRLDFTGLQKQLNQDVQFLKMEKKNEQLQGLFQGMTQGAVNKRH